MRPGPAFALLIFMVSPAMAQKADSLPPIDTDRPDLTDGTGTLPRGHAQLESGFTSQTSRDRLSSWSMPELLLRIGILRRAELRIGETYRSIEIDPGQRVRGFDDLQLGTKVRLVEQGRFPAAISAEAFTTFTTGAAGVSAGRALPGGALLFQASGGGAWSGGAELEAARGATSGLSSFASVSIQYQATRRLQGYGEWYQMQPDGFDGATQHYLDSGVLVLLSNDIQIDARVGAGLNHNADRYFAGFGFAVRR